MTNQIVRAALSDRYTRRSGAVHLTGIQALARLPLELRRADLRAGRRTAAFISGYEGSPLAGYDTELARNAALLDEHDIVFRPGVNEELAATAVQGTQLAATQDDKRVDGVIALWYGKSPGLDRASDAIRHANLMGTHPEGGVLALVGDDPAAKSSTVPGASEGLLADLGLPILYPSDPQEALDFGLHGVAMSRACGLWVALKIATNVADGSGTVDLDPDRVQPVLPDQTVDGVAYRHEVTAQVLQPTLGVLERSREGARLEIARRYAVANDLNRITHSGVGDRLGIVAAGKTYLDVCQALRMLGLDEAELARGGVRLLRLGMIHPLEPSVVRRFAEGLDEILVIEEKRPFIEIAVKDLLYGGSGAPAVFGKRLPGGAVFVPSDGELDPDIIAAKLAARLSIIGGFPSVDRWRASQRGTGIIPRALPLVTRTPYFCSGCPHNISTKTPDGATVGAGIGCHGMVSLMSPDQVGTVTGLTQMGGEGTQWIGMAPFLERTHLLQNLGDGTFHHSGSLAIRASIAAGSHITYKLLYNSAVAMTGGQQAVGVMPVSAVCSAMLAEGVVRIIVTTDEVQRYRKVVLPRGVQVWHRDRLIEAQETLSRTAGVTLLIHDQECATELRRKRKRGLAPTPAERIVINERVCEGCGDCGQKSNCLSVQPFDTEFGRKTRIDQSSCNIDRSCLAGDCPSFLSVVPSGARRRPAGPAIDLDNLPAPSGTLHGTHTTRITGVGGSGVVTLAQLLSTAATLSGLRVRALDQTGLAQKGGAVVSDITLSRDPIEQGSKAIAGGCDLYLGCDLLVAADPRYLAAADPTRTVAVISTSEVPTGQMVTDPTVAFPAAGPIRDQVEANTTESFFLDARSAANALLGADQFANLLLAGAAVQTGALPLKPADIEAAIVLNGVQVEANTSAFRFGRLSVADPVAFAAAVAETGGPAETPHPLSNAAAELIATISTEPASELHRLLSIRVPDLISYQNLSYAKQYSTFIAQVMCAETEKLPGSTALTESVARNLYKLMAYKDEYEVARLSLDPTVRTAIEAEFGRGARIYYRLHPPVLRALGMKNKLELGPWFRPVYRALVALRRVRGTRLDPFGAAVIRRTERALITEYRATVMELLDSLRADTHPLAIEITELPDMIRGYESIKTANIASYRAKSAELLPRYRFVANRGQ
ncbi:indolepyruvate ferredoxin oxidoreductase family protein [Nocardia sp. NPDC101769]|uniref:indolepyruvate ferredoxin oxidoreductase family protein n=1 Tax=Nocardia sp. NPDC101769 TaxID=3364333 RepID=UPI0037F71E01